MEKKKVPEIRLEGFEGEWKTYKLGDVVTYFEDPVETPTNGYFRLGVRSWANGTFHTYVPAGEELSTAQMHRVSANKFIVNITFAWEHAVAITDNDDEGKLVSHRFPQFTFLDDNVPNFFKYVIIDERFRRHLSLASPGGAGRNRVLDIKEMLQYELTVPEPNEQKAIGEYFTNLDDLISNTEDRRTKLLALKNSLLQKIFPQEGESVPRIRFDGFEGEWDKKKLGDLYECNNERNVNKNIGFDKTVSVATMNYKEDGNGAASDSLATYKILRLGDIAFEGHTNKEFLYGRFVLNDIGDGIMSPRFSALRPKKMFPISFWKYYIHHEPVMRKILVNSTKAGTMMNELDIDDFLEQEIYVPGDNEQKAIGDYFTNLDTLIETQEQKITKLQQMKSALLQKMFV